MNEEQRKDWERALLMRVVPKGGNVPRAEVKARRAKDKRARTSRKKNRR